MGSLGSDEWKQNISKGQLARAARMQNKRIEIFWSKVDKSGDCWLWLGKLDRDGYGYFPFRRTIRGAHKVAYLLTKGEVPKGLTLDHLCRNPACVNPDHLEVVTARENILRGGGPAAFNYAKTHCINGHEFNVDNTGYRSKNNRRYCRQCSKERARNYRSKDREAYNAHIRRYKAARKLSPEQKNLECA